MTDERMKQRKRELIYKWNFLYETRARWIFFFLFPATDCFLLPVTRSRHTEINFSSIGHQGRPIASPLKRTNALIKSKYQRWVCQRGITYSVAAGYANGGQGCQRIELFLLLRNSVFKYWSIPEMHNDVFSSVSIKINKEEPSFLYKVTLLI